MDFYHDGVIQPGQSGIVRIPIQTADADGAVESHSDLVTNDPDLPLIKFTVTADVKPVPPYVRRIDNANVANGEPNGAFKLWPTGHPRITLNKGERFSFSLRIWPPGVAGNQQTGATTTAPDGPAAPGGSRLPALPAGALTTVLRQEKPGGAYWLDVTVGPLDRPGTFSSPLVIPRGHDDLAALTSLEVVVVVEQNH